MRRIQFRKTSEWLPSTRRAFVSPFARASTIPLSVTMTSLMLGWQNLAPRMKPVSAANVGGAAVACLLLKDQASGGSEKRKGRLHRAAISRWRRCGLVSATSSRFFPALGTLRLPCRLPDWSSTNHS
jgi:hypothetical protein